MKLNTTSDKDLCNMAKHLNLSHFKIYSSNQLPPNMNNGDKWIVNQDQSDSGRGGTHWVSLTKIDGVLIYFDSFGAEPDPRIITLMNQKGYSFSNVIQDIHSRACGHYCIAFLKHFSDSAPLKELVSTWLSRWSKDVKKNEKELEQWVKLNLEQSPEAKVCNCPNHGEGLFKNPFKKDPNKVKFSGEKHLPGGYNYCGPGSHVAKRLDLEKTKGISKPINEIDCACKNHDIDYGLLRRMVDNGASKREILKKTRAVDNTFLKRVRKAKTGSYGTKAAILTSFNAKKLKENVTGKADFVYGDTSKDVTRKQVTHNDLLYPHCR